MFHKMKCSIWKSKKKKNTLPRKISTELKNDTIGSEKMEEEDFFPLEAHVFQLWTVIKTPIFILEKKTFSRDTAVLK